MSVAGEGMDRLGERLARLSPEQLAALMQQLGASAAAAPADAIAPRDRAAPCPLSFAQQRLWFIQQLDPRNVAYNAVYATRLDGPLDPAALQRALDLVVARHEALRTTIAVHAGEPVQVVAPELGVAIETDDLSSLDADERDAETERRARGEQARPFDLAAGPLVRARLLRFGAGHHVLLLAMHHVVGDGWSRGVMVRELSEAYAALVAGGEPALAPLPVQYPDYAAWQRARLAGPRLDEQLRWWTEKLAGAPPELPLPADRPRPPVQSFAGATHRFALPAGVAGELRALARDEGATLFIVLLAAFKTLLARITGEADLVVGTPAANRARAETAGLIGFFANTLALRTDLSGDPPFREALRRVRDTAVGAYAHEELPFERLVEALHPERDAGRNLLFQVMFLLDEQPPRRFHMDGVVGSPVELDPGTSMFDLTLGIDQAGDGLAARIEYATALFDAATIERMAACFATLLRGIARRPDARIGELPLLPDAERARLERWNATGREYPRTLVHELFAAQAACTPEAPALAHAGRTVTYAELDARANAIAHHLRGLGVRPETRVGVALERTPELIAGLLGVLKAGGAYVPLDPAHPRERLGWMVEDAAIRIVLTTTALAGRLPGGAEAVCVDAPALASPSPEAPASGVLPENLSHLIFTSGSTGRPKGVMIRHSATSVLLHWMREAVTDEERACVLASTSASFDVSVAEIFGTLCWGGKLVLVENALDLPAAAGQEIRYASMVPAAAAELLRLGALPASVRTLNLAGEALPADLARALYETGTVEKVGNLYGPTEDTSYSTYALVGRGADRVTIGRPLANTRARVLDAALSPVPAGVAGDLWLAGAGLARGYAGRPALTAESFVPDPFGPAGARMYRTLDRARWTAGGELEYLGRADFQVKVRGFRVEPGEIEAALRAHPAVGDAVVVVREEVAGDRRLVAYVVAAAEAEAPAAEELRRALRERLPEYMVPSAFVALDAFPLTSSGKIDRRALPAPDAAALGDEGFVAPRTPAEEVLAGIFAEVLGAARVGAHDDFFALGGHSLLATRVVSRIRQAFGAELPLRALFDRPTVAGVAERLAALAGGGEPAPPIVPVPRDRPLPLSFAQQRLWFVDQLEPGRAAYNLAGALRLRGSLDADALERSLAEIVRRHETLRTRFPLVDGEPVQVIDAPGPISLVRVELTGQEERETGLRALAAAEALRPFDLARGPLLRATLARLGADDHALLLTLHHAVSDGWSTAVLVREASELYAAFTGGREPRLPDLPVQYADYAVWQRERMAAGALDAQLGWWRERLAGAPPLLEIPTDRPRTAVPGDRAGSVEVALPAETGRALRALARREGATPFMALLAAWQLLLARYAGQDDVSVGTPVAGRTRLETEGLIGFFVNTLVLRTDLAGSPTFAELLGRVRESTLGAFQHQEIPFERLVEELAPERSLGHTPLFQAMFALQNNVREAVRLGDVAAEPIEPGPGAAKFDLSLALEDAEGGGFAGTLTYRAGLFDRATAERMAAHFAALAGAVAADPARRTDAVPLLDEAGRRQVVEEWNATASLFPDLPVHEQFAAQAARTPDATAVTCGAEALSYAGLDAASNRLANHLRALGVGTDDRVGLCLERGVDTVVAVLGILKAGAAYLPLDPAYPDERLRFMLADAGAAAVVTRGALAGRVSGFGGPVVRIDADAEAIAARPPAAPAGAAVPGSGAYVIYTSGSTGTPKGVLVEHRSVASYLAWFDRTVLGDDGFDIPLVSRLSFDAHVRPLFSPLLRGGSVWVLPEATATDPAALLAALASRERVSFSGVPSLWTAAVELLEAGEAPRPAGLRVVTLGGEAVAPELVERTRALFPGVEIWNHYGPTEATVNVSVARIGVGGRVSIGRPVANVRACVLDAAGQPVPVGVPGELYAGGVGVARGYLGRPALTAERFVPDPFSAVPGARMYRTGDRVRWVEEVRKYESTEVRQGERADDGSARGDEIVLSYSRTFVLDFLGRIDLQVKIRGFRVEPGEIESALRTHPSVRQAAVEVRGSGAQARLVAWVEAAAGAEIDAEALRSHVAARLPEYMVPAAFVALAALPLTVTGKLDRRALPEPGAAPASGYVAPRTETERAVASIWAEVLGAGRVGAHDDFFALGGHSLLATRVVSRVRRLLGAEVPVRAVFEAPTLAGFAAHVGRSAAAARIPALVTRSEAQGLLSRIDSIAETELGRLLRDLPSADEGGAADGISISPTADETRRALAARLRDYAGRREFPLSFSQQRLWFLHRMDPASAAYHVPLALRATGGLDVDVLRRALRAVIARHEALRTTFAERGGRPVQVIADDAADVLAEADLRALEPAERGRELERLARDTATRPFDPARGPLLRAVAARVDDAEWRVLFTAHHLVADGWSMGVLTREVSELYAALAEGREPALAPVATQYADVALWQRRWLAGGALEREAAFWRAELDGAPHLLELPADRPRPAVAGERGEARAFALDARTSAAVAELARREGATLFMTLLAAWQLVLGRWAGQDDVLVGTPVAGRTREELENVVGLFVNTLVLRGRLAGARTFRELLGRVRETTLGAFAHQHLPFERLVEELAVERSLAHTPLFQVLFALRNHERGALRLGDARLEAVESGTGTAKFDLNLTMDEGADGIAGTLVYRADLFEGATAERMLAHFTALLAAVAADPGLPLERVSLLAGDERRLVLEEWNATEAEVPAATIPALFAARAARTPDAPAVVFEREALSYAELDAASNRLANHLRALGVGPDARVGMCLPRGTGLIVSILGILKAGGAYVPLDPGHPAERILGVLEDAGARVAIASGAAADALASFAGAVVRLDADAERIAAASAEAPAADLSADNLAYVIYTSGSTGRPKGVMVRHGSVVNLFAALDRAVYSHRHAAAAPRVSVNGPVTFDTSVKQIVQLLGGATLCIVPDEARYDADAMAAWLREHRVEVLDCTPAQLRHLLADGLLEKAGPALTDLLVAGEAIDPALWSTLAALDGVRAWNLYGPTESTVDAALCRVAGERPVLGGPVANARAYVLDAAGAPAPVGVPGELYVGGAGVARGYAGRAALTAERFVPDPFSATPGARLYRTGDRVRWAEVRKYGSTEVRQVEVRKYGSTEVRRVEVRKYESTEVRRVEVRKYESTEVRQGIGADDGPARADDIVLSYSRTFVLEYIGRTDFQLKISGFRIEPAEVEAALDAHPAVARSVVAARTDGAGEKRLVAWLVAEGEAPPAADLRAFLKARLPEYMVPAAFVALDALPLSANGKIDRRALPAPEWASDGDAFVAPRTATEEIVAGIFAQVLGVEHVGAADDFFALGGHSLVAMRVVSRVREAFGVELPLRALFEAPTVEGVARRVEALGWAGAAASAPIVPVARDGALPLSFAQQRLWFIDQLEPGSAAYNLPYALRLRGALDASALERALGEIVRRHETLRTRFAAAGGEPVQVIDAPRPISIALHDLSGVGDDEREAAVRDLATAEASTPFDLAAGPLLRCALAKLGGGEHVLLLTLHHIVSDGWSTEVLAREVAELYAAFAAGREPILPDLPVQYADFAAWQRARLSGEVLDAQLGWWRERLAGAPPVLDLPTDHPRPAAAGGRAARVPFALGEDATRALRDLSRREGATLFMTVLAAWQLLLSRYSGQDDVSVGTPIAGRTRLETEGLIGFFANTLVLRADLSGRPSFRALLGRVREATLGAYQHQEIPFEKLVEELAPERSLGHTPLFQAMFILRGDAPGPPRLGDVRAEPLEIAYEAAKFDLVLALGQEGGRLAGTLAYRTDLFECATAERMLGHFAALLAGVAAEPDRPALAVPMLSADERRTIVEEWNATDDAFAADVLVHHLVSAQAARTPDAVAVSHGARSLTYAELERRSNQLAHHLRRLGIGPEVRTAVCVERSPELLVALLGVLKSGGAYVPLDPAHPAERLRWVLDDAEARVLVTSSRLAAPFAGDGRAIVRLDTDAAAIEAESVAAPEGGAGPGNLAYVIYTSGSTGRPKGVQVEHRGVAALLHWLGRHVAADELAGVLASTSITFDVSVAELFGTLARGGRLVMVDNALGLADLPSADGVRLAYMVPGAAAELLRLGALPGTVAALNLAGEALPAPLARGLLAAGVGRVANVYGPTEATVYATHAEVEPGAGRVTIGRPILNTRAYVLDPAMGTVPAGVAGELYIGGAQVARGYLNRPALTAEKFVADPFSSIPGARLYRTGDRVRWAEEVRKYGSTGVRQAGGAEDGSARADDIVLPYSRTFVLEYLGRIDFQLKVRGFRIEPGEIEAALRDEPGVGGAVVVAREDAPGERRLVAYLTPGAEAPDPAALRERLRARLPEYMVPAAFVVLDAFPVGTSGKIDRRALPAPEWSGDGDSFVAPRTPAEEIVAGIWGAVLGVGRVGATDDFFALGGHSLLATRIVARIRDAFAVELPLRALFEAPTVEGLAARVDELLRAGSAVSTPPLVPAARGGALPLSFAQRRLWFIDQLQPGSAAYNIPAALRLRGALDAGVLERALAEVVRRHEALRTRFVSVDGEPAQVIDPAGPVAIARFDFSRMRGGAREAAVRDLAAAEAARPFDLAAGPLLRCSLARLGESDHALLLTLHHAVADGWSLDVLVREMSAIYAAFARGETSPLADLPVQYADFAAWQREWLVGDVLDAQLGWWRERLAGAPPLLDLPTDRPRPPAPGGRAGRLPFTLSPGEARALRDLSRGEGATLFMTLLAAWQLLLSRWSGQEDVSVGSPIAGRTRTEIEPLVGFFVNTLVLRTDLSGNPTFRELLARVRETTLGAYQHQDIPFEKLVEELAPQRSLSHTPLFQTWFVLQNAAREPLHLGDVAAEPLDGDAAPAKFDLSLAAAETEDDGLAGTLSYRTELFDAATVERMLGHFRALLAAIAADPERPVARIPLLGEDERREMAGWNATGRAYALDAPLHALVEAQARRTPDAVAVEFESDTLTYAELDARANQLARHLRGLGVRAETRVGICLERSAEMVVALLGVLKAGAAYVPIDPAYPAERIAYMLADSGVAAVLTQERLVSALPEHAARTVCLDRDRAAIAGESPESPEVSVDPDQLAYVIYTSGSTGRPKGAMNAHRGIVNRLLWMQEEYRLSTDDVVLQKTPFSFDVSVWEFFWPLITGARLVLAQPGRHGDAAYLAELIETRGITTLHFVPSMLQAFIDADAPARCGSLRRVMCSGEALPYELMERAIEALPSAGIHNLYGPTEAAVDVTYWPCEPRPARRAVPIGRPVANTRIHVLDAALDEVPAGVAGELYIAGVQVGRGYLDRPSLTAEKFLPDPFSTQPGARMYRTGDRARWVEDVRKYESTEVRTVAGADDGPARADDVVLPYSRTFVLEYLGRTDFQVKVRGFRVEPGEIESALRDHPAVRDAAVVVRDDHGDARLVAYVVPAAGADAAAVRAHLAARLPGHMVPTAFVVMEALPLSANGKLDRRALPAPDAPAAAGYVAPRTEAERTVAGIWAQVLGVERVGVHDDFFALGGHSLRATRVVAHVAKALGVEVPVRALFEAPTLGGFVAEAARAATLDGAHSVPAFMNRSRAEAVMAGMDHIPEDELDRLLDELSTEDEAEW